VIELVDVSVNVTVSGTVPMVGAALNAATGRDGGTLFVLYS
jgi:N-acetylmuramic acid 6-phosphate (MurNAc-6-P) etherase